MIVGDRCVIHGSSEKFPKTCLQRLKRTCGTRLKRCYQKTISKPIPKA